jgi:hypothetical protein
MSFNIVSTDTQSFIQHDVQKSYVMATMKLLLVAASCC